MEAVAIVTVLAILQFFWFGFEVGKMRVKHQCKAPATTGAPEFERMFRVQQNTMEQLVMFIPALWLYASLVNPLWGAGLGVIYLVGRIIYRSAYLRDPAGRSMGFSITVLPTTIMLIWVLIAAGIKLAG
ncbi:MAG: MAPEG family protein [Gammaproteobacteria bacterium]|nr:MAPEG family protein [Gammaproteobacteria bacterium]MDH5304026.1 MAPEG family protein [Gammaproteobacteria bacterium]MDH5321671.1 MAPEG family protein [Gammaproteobacteria bacterium]